MRIRLLAILLVSTLITSLPLATTAATVRDIKKPVEVRKTQNIAFIPRGVIRIQKSFGEVFVDGWDKNEVEVTIIKSIKANDTPEDQERERQKLEGVDVTASRQTADTLVIDSRLPFRRNLDLEYRIKIPRDSDLFIKNRFGESGTR